MTGLTAGRCVESALRFGRADSPRELADALARVGKALDREAQVRPVLERLAGHG